ncbi:MAG: glycosyltransferase [Mogibacterium sp.]|nr:glycosyltransferase [Mogibacterium sp.]
MNSVSGKKRIEGRCEKELISVIVPIYGMEKYLDRCIESILRQTYPNLQIILVDDGSRDSCPKICDEWAKKDERVKVIHKEQEGVASARNAGLDFADGVFISFVDADDYLSFDMLETLHDMIISSDADIAECEYIKVHDDNYAFKKESNAARIEYNSSEALTALIADRFFKQIVWNKLFRKSAIGNIRFPDVDIYEDEYFTYRVIGESEKLVRSDEVLYAYRQHDKSKMYARENAADMQAIECRLKRHEYIKTHYKSLTKLSAQNICSSCIYWGQAAMRNQEGKDVDIFIRGLQEVVNIYAEEASSNTFKEYIWLKISSKSLKTACTLRNMLGIGM